VSDVLRTAARTVTEADVLRFAELTGDSHPQHVDEAWAAGSVFGERIAHGMLVMSLAVGLVPFDPERLLALRRISDLVFKRPVRLGDSIQVWATPAARKTMDHETELVSWSWKITNQREQLVCQAKLDVLMRAEPQEAAR
jgi:acyl dehydratase